MDERLLTRSAPYNDLDIVGFGGNDARDGAETKYMDLGEKL